MHGTTDHKDEETSKDEDACKLKVNTSDHGICAVRGEALGCRVEGDSSESAAYSLEDKGDDINGAECPEISSWAQGRSPSSCDLDDPAEDDIHGRCKESRGENQSADLHQECVCIVRTFIGPGTSCPAEEFGYDVSVVVEV